MAKLSGITTPSLTFDEGAAPSTPAANKVILYAKADGLLYSKDDAGAETAVSGGGSGTAISACLAQRTTSQSVSADPTAIALNATDLYDPDGWHDPASNNTRLTCPTGKGGKMFIVTGSLEYDGSASAMCYIRIRKNGTTVVGQQVIPQNVYTGTIAVPVYLADSDYVEMLITNRTTGNVIVTDAPITLGIMG